MRTKNSKKELQDFRGMPPEDLAVKLKEAKEELFRLRFQLAIRQLENTAQIGEVRNRIAVLQTVLRESQSAAAN